MNPHVEPRANKLWPFLLQAAALGTVLATVLSALSIAGVDTLIAISARRLEFESAPTLWDAAKATVLLCAITVVWCGPFGFLAGGVGAAVMHLRRQRIRTFKRLLIESAALGLLAAFVFPFYDAAAQSGSFRDIRYQYSIAQWIAIWILCFTSSIICAVAFRKRFVGTADLV